MCCMIIDIPIIVPKNAEKRKKSGIVKILLTLASYIYFNTLCNLGIIISRKSEP